MRWTAFTLASLVACALACGPAPAPITAKPQPAKPESKEGPAGKKPEKPDTFEAIDPRAQFGDPKTDVQLARALELLKSWHVFEGLTRPRAS